MKIAIIGAGTVVSTLGKGWAKKGHDVFFGVRNPKDEKTRQVVQSIGGKAQAGSVADAAAFGQIVVLAIPWNAAEATIRSAGDLRGKIVIDCTNPLKPDLSGLEVGFSNSAAEQ